MEVKLVAMLRQCTQLTSGKYVDILVTFQTLLLLNVTHTKIIALAPVARKLVSVNQWLNF